MEKDYFSRLKGIYFSPLCTIAALKKEKGLKDGFMFLLISSVIAGAISIIFEIIKGNPMIETMPLPVAAVVNALMVVMFDMAVIFSMSGLFHLLIMAFGGNKPYYQTFKPFAYISCFWIMTAFIAGLNPYIPFIWVVNFIIMIWMLVLIGTGLRHYTELSSGKLFTVWLIITSIVIILLYLSMDTLLAVIPAA
jgi:hypothetical protein